MLRFERDEWLSGVLGRSSWKVDGIEAGTPPSELRARLANGGQDRASFFSAKIPTHDVGALVSAVRAGFQVVDVNVTFEWVELPIQVTDGDDCAVAVEVAGAGDVFELGELAGRCFRYTRFHLDPAIGADQANEIKRQWARNSCRGRATEVYIARRQGSVTGFLAVLEKRSDHRRDAIIDLVGVDAASQRRGVGRALSAEFIMRWRGRADRLRVGTQVSNIPALRLYESLGFRIADTAYVLHAHARNGAVV